MLEAPYEIILVATVGAVYALLGYQLYRKNPRGAPVARANQAFSLLEMELRRALPSLPLGFTWREAVDEARKSGVDVDWSELGREVDAYEAFRYGGEEEPVEFRGVLALASRLRGTR